MYELYEGKTISTNDIVVGLLDKDEQGNSYIIETYDEQLSWEVYPESIRKIKGVKNENTSRT